MAQRWWVLGGLVAARIAFGFHFQSLATVGPGVMADLGIDATALGTLIGLFMLPGLLLALPGAVLADRFGERPLLGLGLALMVVGGLIGGMADGYGLLALSRLLAGIGAVAINVLMSKIVIDWFIGKEIASAMSLYIAGFPLGLALALATLGGVATAESWALASFWAAGLSLLALGVFAITYRTAGSAAAPPSQLRYVLSPRETKLVSLAGLCWMLVNGAFIVMLAFVPLFLVENGHSVPAAAALIGIAPLVGIAAIPLGGYLIDRFRRTDAIVVIGILGWTAGMLLLIPLAPAAPAMLALLLAVTSLLGAIPSGQLVALPGEVLSPRTRAQGMGLFYTWFYAGTACFPAVAGAVLDTVRDPVAAVYLTAAILIVALVLFIVFRFIQRHLPQPV